MARRTLCSAVRDQFDASTYGDSSKIVATQASCCACGEAKYEVSVTYIGFI